MEADYHDRKLEKSMRIMNKRGKYRINTFGDDSCKPGHRDWLFISFYNLETVNNEEQKEISNKKGFTISML